MRFLILAMLLAVAQTPSPVPRKTPDSANGTSQGVTKDASSNKAPAQSSPPLVKSIESNPEQNPGNTKKTKDDGQTVRVRELPSVSVSRDWADWLLWAFNGLLVIAGFLGIRFAYKTLKTIEKQTKATEDAATATQDSVELQKVAMEQWIDIRELTVQAYVPQGVNESKFPMSFKLGNPTKFPLTLKTLTIWIDRKHIQSVVYRYLLLPPDKDIPVAVEWHIEGVNLSNYRANFLMFELGGLITFTDAFKEAREQKFGFICKCGPTNGGKFDLIAFTTPDEEKKIEEQENWRETPN